MFLNSVVSDYASIILGRIQIRYSKNANPDPEYRKSFRIHNTGFASLPNNFFLLVKFNKILGTLPVVTLKKEAVPVPIPVLVPYAVVPYKSIRLLIFVFLHLFAALQEKQSLITENHLVMISSVSGCGASASWSLTHSSTRIHQTYLNCTKVYTSTRTFQQSAVLRSR